MSQIEKKMTGGLKKKNESLTVYVRKNERKMGGKVKVRKTTEKRVIRF